MNRQNTDPDNPFQLAVPHPLVQMDKDKIRKILRMKTQKQEKEKEVDDLKHEVAQMQKDTEDKLSGLMRTITKMTEQV